jgi:hypothetical protein
MIRRDTLQAVPVTSSVRETYENRFKAAVPGTSADNYSSVMVQELESLFSEEDEESEKTAQVGQTELLAIQHDLLENAAALILELHTKVNELQQQLEKYQESEKKVEVV